MLFQNFKQLTLYGRVHFISGDTNNMKKFSRYALIGVLSFTLAACEKAGVSFMEGSIPASTVNDGSDKISKSKRPTLDVVALIGGPPSKVEFDKGFASAMRQAVEQDPLVKAAKNAVAANKANIRVSESGRDIQLKSTILGGVEDISDEEIGVAAIVTANRMLYDGGMLDAKIDADKFTTKASEQEYMAVRGDRALQLAHAWIELDRYQSLKELIDSRLTVVAPIVDQLERVAVSGAGDVSQVASARRIVSSILVAEAEVSGRYQQASISFINGFGHLPSKVKYDASWVSNLLPDSKPEYLAENSPKLLTKYWNYRAAEASVAATKAKNNFQIGFKVRLQRPFGGSGMNSDESVGIGIEKDFYQGDQLKAQVDRAEAIADAKAAEVSAVFQQGALVISSSRESIDIINKSIALAKYNAKNAREEIDFSRKQLIIGGSTLESVLSAEARLYQAESKEIDFVAERRKAEVTILSLTGFFSQALTSE